MRSIASPDRRRDRLSAARRAIGLVLASLALGAAGAASSAALTLDEGLRLAVSSHPTVAARRSEREAAGMRLEAAEWGRYPALSAQYATDQAGRRFTTARLEQPLWTGGVITGQIDGAQAGVRGADASLTESQQEIMLRVVTAFTELGRVHARQLAAQANVAEHERLAALIARRVSNEVSPASDGVLASARLAQARAELTQLDALAARARSALSQAVSRDVHEIALPSPRTLGYPSLTLTIEAAQAFSPALRRLSAEEEAAGAEVAVRRGATRPRVVARYDRTFGGREVEGDQFFVAVEFQPGAGLSSLAAVREAEARRNAARLAREGALRDLLDSLNADWADMESLGRQARDLRAQVESTTSVFDSFVRQYAVGRKSWLDVLNAQREASQARYALADTEWGALRATLRLQLATGELNASTVLAQAPE